MTTFDLGHFATDVANQLKKLEELKQEEEFKYKELKRTMDAETIQLEEETELEELVRNELEQQSQTKRLTSTLQGILQNERTLKNQLSRISDKNIDLQTMCNSLKIEIEEFSRNRGNLGERRKRKLRDLKIYFESLPEYIKVQAQSEQLIHLKHKLQELSELGATKADETVKLMKEKESYLDRETSRLIASIQSIQQQKSNMKQSIAEANQSVEKVRENQRQDYSAAEKRKTSLLGEINQISEACSKFENQLINNLLPEIESQLHDTRSRLMYKSRLLHNDDTELVFEK